MEAGTLPATGSLEERLFHLENTVAALKRTLQKERALLRKAILIQLDMKEVYDESLEEGDV
jgi:hypothetical protein